MFLPSPATSRVIPSAVWNLTLWETNGSETSLPGEGPEPRSIGTRLCHLTPSTHCYHPALCQTCHHLTSCTSISQRFLASQNDSSLCPWQNHRMSRYSSSKVCLTFWAALVIVHWPQFHSNQSISFPKISLWMWAWLLSNKPKMLFFQTHLIMRFTTEQALSWNGVCGQYSTGISTLKLNC